MPKPYAHLRAQMSPAAQRQAEAQSRALLAAMPTTGKYILDGHTPVPEPDLYAWGRWFERSDRHVADTLITPAVRVSTVFLGVDHQDGDGAPLLFETMVFRAGACEDMARCSTWQEAEVMHQRMVARVHATLEDDDV